MNDQGAAQYAAWQEEEAARLAEEREDEINHRATVCSLFAAGLREGADA